jgi:hypothetical protein
VISVGEEVRDALMLHCSDKTFVLTAPSDGTFVVDLSWDPHKGPLVLQLDTIEVAPPWAWPGRPDSSPIVGRLAVIAGRSYRVTVADHPLSGAGCWDYDYDAVGAFVLRTSME